MTAEFARLGLRFQRIAAIDGASRVSDEAPPPLSGSPPHRLLSRGEIACFLSHRACWMLVADSEDAYTAIFEDDVHFADDAATMLSRHDWIPPNADLVKVETMLLKTRIGRRTLGAASRFRLARLFSLHTGSAGYILSRQAAKSLLETTADLTGPVDHALFDPHFPSSKALTIYQLVPALCVQDVLPGRAQTARSMPSIINEDRMRESLADRAASVAPAATLVRQGTLPTPLRRLWRRIKIVWLSRKVPAVPFGGTRSVMTPVEHNAL